MHSLHNEWLHVGIHGMHRIAHVYAWPSIVYARPSIMRWMVHEVTALYGALQRICVHILIALIYDGMIDIMVEAA